MNYTDRIEEIIAKANGSLMASKASISTSTGIVAYDLEPLLKQVYPVLTPFRNKYLPRRVSTKGGTSFNAKLLTSISPVSGGIGILEGKRGRDVSLTEQDVAVSYRTVGQDGSTTFEGEDAADSFDDARAVLMTTLLNSNLMEEEQLALFGNGGNIMRAGGSAQTALGTSPTPVLTNNAGGVGTVAAATYNVWCVALTYQGVRNSSVVNGVAGQFTVTTNDGASQTINGGNSAVSAASNAITLGGVGSLAATVQAVRGAFGYAWFVGTSKAAAALAAITSVNSMVLLAPAAGTQLANDAKVATDFSIDSYVYDGLFTQTAQSNSGAYWNSLDGANLTSNGAAGITQIDLALINMYQRFKLDPDLIYTDAGTSTFANFRVISGGGAPLFRFNLDAKSGGVDVIANATAGSYINPITKKIIKLEVHPFFPVGTIGFISTSLPYTTPNVPIPYRLQSRSRDWTEYEWPLVTRTRGRGQYGSFGLINYVPWSQALIQNVGQA
jgi:hypothetical protein